MFCPQSLVLVCKLLQVASPEILISMNYEVGNIEPNNHTPLVFNEILNHLRRFCHVWCNIMDSVTGLWSELEWLDLGQSTVCSPEKLGNFYRFLAFGEEYPYTTISGEVGWGCYILLRLCIYINIYMCVYYIIDINLVHIVTSIGNSWHLQSATAVIHAAPRQGPPAPRSQGVISASVVVAPG